MPLFHKSIWNPATRRHELEFINQQADLIFLLRWDTASGAYAFDMDDDEICRCAQSWRGAAFDVGAERKAGALLLTSLDREYPHGK